MNKNSQKKLMLYFLNFHKTIQNNDMIKVVQFLWLWISPIFDLIK